MPGDVILPDMGLVQPAVNGDVNTWGGIINSNTAKIDSHNHAFGQGDRVPSLGININSDLTFASLFAPVNVHRIQFSEITAITDGTQNESIFVNAADSELYWRTALGNNVKLTAGNSLNVSAFVGGIVGDYVAVGAAEAFVDSDKAYTFKDGAGKRARVDAGSVKLLAFGTNNTIGVTLAARSDIALSYTATWPNALPGSGTVTVQVDSTGQISYADFPLHGSRTLQIAAQSGTALESKWVNDPTNVTFGKNSVGNGFLTVPIPLTAGVRVTGARYNLSGDGSADLSAVLIMLRSDGAPVNMAIQVTNNQGALAPVVMTVTPRVLAADESCFMTFLSSASGLHLENITITYDHLT